MIIVELAGGLGNQMFQYAMGRHLAYIHKCELKLNLSFFYQNNPFTYRKFSLDAFNIKYKIASADDIHKFTFKTGNSFSGQLNKLKQLINPYYILQEPYFHFYSSALSTSKNTLVKGYWQCEKYFRPIEDIIRQEFTLKHKLSKKSREVAGEIQKVNSVSMHIRRGDYANDTVIKAIHGICSLEYYEKAIKHITTLVHKPYFFIFSDDIDWVKENMNVAYSHTYITHNHEKADYEDLYLMNLCRHNIIANSTFSWWGAWLNQSPDKIVIAPSRWFNDSSINTNDLIPQTWIRIQS